MNTNYIFTKDLDFPDLDKSPAPFILIEYLPEGTVIDETTTNVSKPIILENVDV